MKIKPECRCCGSRVSYFGEVCCTSEEEVMAAAEGDALVKADLWAMQSRMAAEDY